MGTVSTVALCTPSASERLCATLNTKTAYSRGKGKSSIKSNKSGFMPPRKSACSRAGGRMQGRGEERRGLCGVSHSI